MNSKFAKIGEQVSFSKTVGESDVYLFAGITGDFAEMHINEAFMEKSSYGRRIAHGALLIGFMSTTSTMMVHKTLADNPDLTPVSLGYDRIRFLAPVFINDTVTVTYQIEEVDAEKRRSNAKITVHNQEQTLVAVANHLLKWVPNATADNRTAEA